MKLRPTPSLFVAVLALVVALGGAGYAGTLIGSAQIKDHSIQSVDIAPGLSGSLLKAGSVSSKALAHNCQTGSLKVAGVCLIKKANAVAPLATAIDHCSKLGGRIASYSEIAELPLLGASTKGVTWSMGMLSQYEYTSTYTLDGDFNAVRSDYSGNVLTNDTVDRAYHCVTYP